MAKVNLSLLVDNSAGVLMRIAGLISRRGFNIDSLAVGECETESISRITIAVDCDELIIEQMIGQLSKLLCVKKISVLQKNESISRELVIVKVSSGVNERSEIMQICDIFNARIVDVTKESVTIEITGELEKIDAFLNILTEHNIIEMARTGIVSLQRGRKTIYD